MKRGFACGLLALGLPLPLVAQTPARPDERLLTVGATAVVEREPDQVAVHLAVETFSASAQEAARGNAAKMDALIAALRRARVARERIRTVSYSLNPEYDFRQERQPGQERLVGYRALNMVRITLDSVARAGDIIDAAIAAGANRITGLSFQLRDPEAARLEAVRAAVAKARVEAEAVAQAVGQQLGSVVAISTTGELPPIRPMAMEGRAMAARSVATPIEPGTLSVSATVTATFRLEPR
ncbi:MAG: SIMPL domain-containing protein [Gemmatimonadetes bacterium]|nr:SIMPL domain-containing protein [Gemmatimonadota bacterium]